MSTEIENEIDHWKWIAHVFFQRLGGNLLSNSASNEYVAAIPDKNDRMLIVKGDTPLVALASIARISNLEEHVDELISKCPQETISKDSQDPIAAVFRALNKEKEK